MARMSTKENKNIYQQLREAQKWSREKASEEMEGIQADRIERIESGKSTAHPDEVVIMAEKYKAPQLCNYYCANECEIGKQYVPEVKMKDLTQIVLEMLSSLNTAKKKQERLIEITADGQIEKDEVDMDAKMVYVEDLLRITRKCSFRKLLEKQHSKIEKIVTFLIILEMMKIGKIDIEQEELFDDIEITYKGDLE